MTAVRSTNPVVEPTQPSPAVTASRLVWAIRATPKRPRQTVLTLAQPLWMRILLCAEPYAARAPPRPQSVRLQSPPLAQMLIYLAPALWAEPLFSEFNSCKRASRGGTSALLRIFARLSRISSVLTYEARKVSAQISPFALRSAS